ncbi:MAG: hypothetical protein ACK2TV_11760, partial [Anaerolineales bacterium]
GLSRLCTTCSLSVDSRDILRELVVGAPDQRLRTNRESCAPPNKDVQVDPMPRRLRCLHWSTYRQRSLPNPTLT